MSRKEWIKEKLVYLLSTIKLGLLKIEEWNLNTQNLHHENLKDLKEKGKVVKALKKKKRSRNTIGILDIRGLDVSIEFIEAKDNVVKCDNNLITLPEQSYYLTSAKKLGKVDLRKSIPLFVKQLRENKDMKLLPLTVKQTGGTINLNKESQQKVLEGKILTSFLNAMQITKTQLFMFGSMGVVCWEILQVVGTIILTVVNGSGGA